MGLWDLLVSVLLLAWVLVCAVATDVTPSKLSSLQLLKGQDIRETKCGVRPVKGAKQPLEFFTRIVGGRASEVGGQPWTVSLQLDNKHICGGSIVQDSVVVTAAHCVYPVDKNKEPRMKVIVGDYDQNVTDPQEQSIPVLKIVIHPNYRSGESMNYDIALLYLTRSISFGSLVQPICLPQADDKIEAGTLCVSSGWGRTTENGDLSPILQEVRLPIIDNATCSAVLSALGLPNLHETMMCAGFPDGGKDACQGDSGGPLVCRRRSGIWFLAGCTSWGLGCGRIWAGRNQTENELGSPAIFAKVSALLEFLKDSPADEGCSSKALEIYGRTGELLYPVNKKMYSNNSLCLWTITVPSDKVISLKIIWMDIESHVTCAYDYLSFTVKGKTVRKVCGSTAPSPLLIPSNQVTVTFFSDGSIDGRGFELHFLAVRATSAAGSGCGSNAVLRNEGKIYSANYPDNYPSSTTCHWIITAPKNHVIKVSFEDFQLEYQKDCRYDYVSIYDGDKTLRLAKLCGLTLPGPVISQEDTMFINFKSDQENNYVGFKANFTFIPSREVHAENIPTERPATQGPSPKPIPLDDCGIAPLSPLWVLPRIVGGEEACPNCWPWQIAVLFLKEFHCGGVLISPQWVLTSAHCIGYRDPIHWLALAGDHDRMLNESTEQVRAVGAIKVHENFDLRTYDNDIALLWLKEPLELNNFVRPVCLPSKEEPLAPSSVCVATGWRSDQVGRPAMRLQQLQVPILDSNVCNNSYYQGALRESMFCVGFPSHQGKEECMGDTGGPLVCRNEKKPFVLYGLVSWGVGCVKALKPGVYTKIRMFLSWIQHAQQVIEIENIQINKPNTSQAQKELVQGETSAHGCSVEVLLKGSVGSIASPGYPYGYAAGLNCSWLINISPNSIIKMTIEQLSIEESVDCVKESLSVYQEENESRQLLGRRCGFLSAPVTYQSTGPMIRVQFQSAQQGSYGKRGFVLLYSIYGGQVHVSREFTEGSNVTAHKPQKSCSDVVLTSEGTITSPGYPGEYPNNISCQWRIIAPLSRVIRLDFQAFKVERDTSGCQDKLLVYEGTGENKTLIGTFCGEMSSYSLKSSDSEMTLIFTTNSNVTLNGFTLHYSFWEVQSESTKRNGDVASVACPILDLLPAGSVELKSPGYPDTYPNRQDCQWMIQSHTGKRLQLLISDLALENSSHCTWDSLKVYDGPSNLSQMLANLCGQKRDLVLQSTGSFLTLHFHTDQSVGNRGFLVRYGEVTNTSQTMRAAISPSIKRNCGTTEVDPIINGRSDTMAKVITDEKGNGRMVGGHPSPTKSWPWIVSIRDQDKKHFCGGAIIHEKWILTAAHCAFVVGSDRVFVGHNDLTDSVSQEVIVIKAYVHKLYDSKKLPPSYDILLLELKTPIVPDDTVSAVCLPGKTEVITNPLCLTAGWGMTDPSKQIYANKLQQAKLPMVSMESCKSYWGKDVTDGNLCAGAAGASSCMGDSGGPLICKVGDRYQLTGVVSWGSNDCDGKAPAVYTKISLYTEWIEQYVGA